MKFLSATTTTTTAFLLLVLSTAVRGQQLAGGYSSVDDICSTNVQAAATVAGDAACSQLNVVGDCQYTVTSAREQVVAGMNYELKMAITDANTGNCTDAFLSIVYVTLEGDASVTSTEPMTCDQVTLPETPCPVEEMPGGWSDITGLCAEDVQAAANAAVQSECPTSFADLVGDDCAAANYRVIKGSQQVVAGMNYGLQIAIVDETNACLYAFSSDIYVPLGTGDAGSVLSNVEVMDCSAIASIPDMCMPGQDGSGEPPVNSSSSGLGAAAPGDSAPDAATQTPEGTAAPTSDTSGAAARRVASILVATAAFVLI